ncbi:hypothetical protein JIN78_17070, partial [Roseibacillus ishigakijimensis]
KEQPAEPKTPERTELAPAPQMAFLFLTRGDLHQPDGWRSYLATAGERATIYNNARAEEAIAPDSPLFGRQIREAVTDTAWGDLSLVRATLALLQEALAEESNS